jgi:uncharacterized glyoxalase superfamily protein PhnB
MQNRTKAIPDGYHTVTPYLLCQRVADVLSFVERAFDAEVLQRMPSPDGKVVHAEVRIGDSRVMLGEASREWRPMPGSVYVYVDDVDEVYRRAIAAGGRSIMEPADMFYGDRNSGVADPGGNVWWISTHVEDVADDELTARAAERFGRADP